MSKLNDQEKSVVIALWKEGLSVREIGDRIGRGKSSIADLIKKYKTTGNTERSKGSGRPRKTTIVQDTFLVLRSKRNRFKTSPKLQADLATATGIEISSSTVRRRLLNANLRARRSLQKPFLKISSKICRLQWAREHSNWTREMWNNVVFSDESKFKLHVGDGRLIVRRKPGERLSDVCIQQVPNKTEGVMVWGCFSNAGLGHLAFVDARVTGNVYLDILERHLKPSVLELFSETESFIFQQDNAPAHRSKQVKKYLVDNSIYTMEWPPYSPDMNPIENIWSIMKHKVRQSNPETIQQLERQIQIAWEDISNDVIQNLIDSMSNRCAAVIKANGGHTKY